MEKILFETLDISDELKRAVSDMGFVEATPVQSQSIGPMLEGRDMVAQAPTGTGKTCAFGIPLVEGMDTSSRNVLAMILCPTRELVVQTTDELMKLTKYKKSIRIVPIYGGQNIDRQIMALKRKPQIIVATPGRLMDHMRRRTIRLDHLQYMVLDEADEIRCAELARIAIQTAMHVCELFAQHQHFLRLQRLQMDDRRQQIPGARLGEFAFSQTGTQCLIAVYAPAAVFDGLRRRAHDDAQILRLALQSVIIHGEQLLIIILSGDGIGDLVCLHAVTRHRLFPKDQKHRQMTGAFLMDRSETRAVSHADGAAWMRTHATGSSYGTA